MVGQMLRALRQQDGRLGVLDDGTSTAAGRIGRTAAIFAITGSAS